MTVSTVRASLHPGREGLLVQSAADQVHNVEAAQGWQVQVLANVAMTDYTSQAKGRKRWRSCAPSESPLHGHTSVT